MTDSAPHATQTLRIDISAEAVVLVILVFLLVHWQASVFFQSFFLHRYGAHGQFTMSKRWERIFHFLTWLTMGSSYLSSRAYAHLHRMHHAYSDTPRDPHSPVHHRLLPMMWRTNIIYGRLRRGTLTPEARFDGPTPFRPFFDVALSRWPAAVSMGAVYTLFYVAFATEWWMLAFLPVHWLMGPIHGAIVNYCGHKVGYRNFRTRDNSRNTLLFDFLTMGELFQNNHHRFPMSPSFAMRWFEIDPCFSIMRVFAALGIIQLPAGPSTEVRAAALVRVESVPQAPLRSRRSSM
jgi:stearoyl-CoA desaturase (Delta-9 desaturase)